MKKMMELRFEFVLVNLVLLFHILVLSFHILDPNFILTHNMVSIKDTACLCTILIERGLVKIICPRNHIYIVIVIQ
jgi:hypothetical protein